MKTSLTADQIAVMAILANASDELYRTPSGRTMAEVVRRILADYVLEATREE